MKKYLILSFFITLNLWAFDQAHKNFDELLKKIVTYSGNQTLVDYKGLKNDPLKLQQYLKELSKVKQKEFDTFNKRDQLAFLINAYNAFTLKLIIDNYPVKSIKKIGGLFSNPWKKEFFKLFGKKSHLDMLEHDLIRKIYKEPRIHFALNCASISCPNLGAFAFTGEQLESQLEISTKLFLKDPNKNYYKDGSLFVSKIFDWYGDDFKEKYGDFKNLVIKYITTDKVIKVKFLPYDWDLNEKK